MKSTLATIGLAALAINLISCSQAQFSKANPTAQGVVSVSCTGQVCVANHIDTLVVNKQPVDILFIVDNGGSVSDVQANIASRFGAFMNQVASLDYRIGVTTTDISSNVSDTVNNPPSAINGYGALQNGRLIAVDGAGDYFITPQLPNPAMLFANTIQRPETAACVASNYTNCPSSDPRAIFAANLLVQANYNSFLRPQVPLTIIIVSDDDERNSSDYAPEGVNDSPSTLIANVSTQFPQKPLTVDAIVIEPGDTACYNQRFGRNGNPFLFGHYAPIYASLVSQTNGVLASICASDYTSELGQIGSVVNQQSQNMKLACRPTGDSYSVTFSPQPSVAISTTPDWSSKQISFSQAIPAGTTVSVSYSCAM